MIWSLNVARASGLRIRQAGRLPYLAVILLALLALLPAPAHAQTNATPAAPFARAIENFEFRDHRAFPKPGGVVVVGSSSILKWRTIQADLAPLDIIPRGFGGSQMAHVLMYANRIVIPYKPSAVVLYAGENDIAAGTPPTQVVADAQAFFALVHAAVPRAQLYYVSMKPSPKRWHLWPAMQEANQQIRSLCTRPDYLEYVDVATAMLGPDGTPRPELFVEDRLHMNEAGYALWTSILKPRLLHD